jgi:hypothetical protein
LTEERTGETHWLTAVGLSISCEYAVCGQAAGFAFDGNIVRHPDRPITCPRCLALLRRVGGQSAEDVQLRASLADGAAQAARIREGMPDGVSYHFDEDGGDKSTPPRGGYF